MLRESKHQARAPRVDLRRPAVLINSDGFESEVIILNISSGGFCLEAVDAPPRIGEAVKLRAEKGVEFAAEVRWVLGPEVGGVFLEPAEFDGL